MLHCTYDTIQKAFQPQSSIHMQPVWDHGVLYSGGDFGYLYAQRASDGALLWSRKIANSGISQPVIVNGVIYEQTPNTRVAVHANDGSEIWQISTPYYSSFQEKTIAADTDTVYLVSSEFHAPGTLTALHTTNGQQIWSTSLPNLQPVTPIIANGVVYVVGDGVFAVDAPNGKQLWHSPAPVAQAQYTTPVVSNGVLYVTTMEDTDSAPASTPVGKHSAIDALDTQSGKLLWHTILDGWPAEPVAVANGAVYTGYDHSTSVVQSTTNIVALAANNGSILWSVQPNAPVTFFMQVMPPPIVAGTMLYIPGRGITAIDLTTHTLRWQHVISQRPSAAIAVAGNVLYTGAGGSLMFLCGVPHQPPSIDGRTATVQADTGNIIWQQELIGGQTIPVN